MSGPINWIEGPEIVDVSPPGGPDTPWGAPGQASGSSASLRSFGFPQGVKSFHGRKQASGQT